MPSSGGSRSQRQTTVTEPWRPSQPMYIESILDAQDLYRQGGLSFDYPDLTVAPLSPETGQAWAGTAARARAGSPLLDQSQDYISDVLSGKYLTREAPGFEDVLGGIRDRIALQKSGAGRYGSEVHDAALAREFGALEFQKYMQERGLQQDAAGLAPGLAREDYYDLDRLGQVGTERRRFLQEQISDEAARQQWQQQQEANAIALYQSLLGGNLGGVTTANVPVQQTNPWLLGLGAATSLGGSYLGNPGIF